MEVQHARLVERDLVARAVRAAALREGLGAGVEGGLGEVGSLPVAAGHRVAHDVQLAGGAGGHGLKRVGAHHEQLGAGLAVAHGKGAAAGEHLVGDAAQGDQVGGLGGAVAVVDLDVAEALLGAAHRLGAQRLAHEDHAVQARHELAAEGGVGEALVEEGGRGHPVGGAAACEAREGGGQARVGPRLVGEEGVAALEAREQVGRAQVEREGRTVEPHAPREAGLGPLAGGFLEAVVALHPGHHVVNALAAHLHALGRAGAAGGEEDVVGVLGGKALQARSALGGALAGGAQLVGTEDGGAERIAPAREGADGVEHRGGGHLRGDVGHALGRVDGVHRRVGMTRLHAGQEAHHHEGVLVAVHHEGRPRRDGRVGGYPAGQGVGRAAQLGVGDAGPVAVGEGHAPAELIGMGVDCIDIRACDHGGTCPSRRLGALGRVGGS